ncbi:MAG: CapA family protein [bacterium]|nr:CapA family protein [bacterium]
MLSPRFRFILFGLLGLAFGLGFVAFMMRFSVRVPFVSINPPSYPGVKTVGMWQGGGIRVEEPPIRLLFAGDIMLDRNVARRSLLAKDLGRPFRLLPEDWFSSADFALANLEGPVTDKRRPPEKSIDFQFDPTLIPVLKDQGIDAFDQANNHALDQGEAGYVDSVKRLRDAEFLVFGHQVKDDTVGMATTTIRGKRFAFLGFNTTDNPLDRAAVTADLAVAKQQADFIIVMMHWGQEYRDTPEANTKEMAHWLIDQGADAVIGGHPHWVQGIESYKNHPIAYSLGNFIFDQDFSIETRQGLAVELDVSDHGVILKPIPIQIDQSQPRVLVGAEKQKRLEALAKISDAGLKEQILEGAISF